LFDEAVHEDPNFALAHIYAAHCYSNLKDQTTAAPHYEAAFQLAPGVSERERLFIVGSYYARYRVDLNKARQQYEALISLYPDDAWGGNNLFNLLQGEPFLPERLRTLERIAVTRPNNVQVRYRLYLAYSFTAPNQGKARQYRDELMRLRARGAEATLFEWIFLDLEDALSAWRRGDVATAQRELDRLAARGFAGEEWFNAALLARANLLVGRLRSARHLCELVTQPDFREVCLARVEDEAGNIAGLRQHAMALTRIELDPHSDGPAVIVALLARRGLANDAERLARRLPFLRSPRYTAAAGWLSFARRQYSAAAKEFAANYPPITGEVFPRTMYYLNREGLAFALAKTGRADEGIGMLQRDTAAADVRILEVFPWLHCRVTLVRLLRQSHRVDEARKVEAELRQYLSQADPDHPILAELKRVQ